MKLWDVALRSAYLNHQAPNLFPALAHTYCHVTQQRRMSNIRSIAVALNVARPFELCGICMPRSYITSLQLLELLLCSQLVRLWVLALASE